MKELAKLVVLGLVVFSTALFAQMPAVSSGTVKRISNFPSRFVDARNIDVWMPDDYPGKKKYAVLYMHDGQMLFDAKTTWNKQEWGVDETFGKLFKKGEIRDTIVVGIWNNGKYRHSEYYPQKTLNALPDNTREFIIKRSLQNRPQSDNYLKFLVEELKPYIDREFPTESGVENTFIAGSSMGGLISIYAICEYPDVFGGAAGISTHLPMVLGDKVPDPNAVPASFRSYLAKHLPEANSRKIYFDYGDQTLDALYPPLQRMVDKIMKAKGWTDKAWKTKFFAGDDHSERSWSNRFHVPVKYLLAK
ncbi:MAG: esterase [Pyrinomonadaceae bacterium]|nr:esterase [Pyrinomonadaceae bacterium]